MPKYIKDLKERLREVCELRAQLDPLGFSQGHPTIVEFKKDCNDYIRNQVNCTKKLPLNEYGYIMEYSLTLTRAACWIKLKKCEQ